MEQGEQVTGVLTNKPNAKNKRDLDIGIAYRLETADVNRAAEGSCSYKMYVFVFVFFSLFFFWSLSFCLGGGF